jgi:hypothetical protein
MKLCGNAGNCCSSTSACASAGDTENWRGHENREMSLLLCAKCNRVAFSGMTFFSNFWDYFIEAQPKADTL